MLFIGEILLLAQILCSFWWFTVSLLYILSSLLVYLQTHIVTVLWNCKFTFCINAFIFIVFLFIWTQHCRDIGSLSFQPDRSSPPEHLQGSVYFGKKYCVNATLKVTLPSLQITSPEINGVLQMMKSSLRKTNIFRLCKYTEQQGFFISTQQTLTQPTRLFPALQLVQLKLACDSSFPSSNLLGLSVSNVCLNLFSLFKLLSLFFLFSFLLWVFGPN